MIFGFTLETFTQIHVFISLVGIASGFVVVGGMLRSHRDSSTTSVFLHSTLLTSITGLLLPSAGITPAVVLGYLSIALMFVAFLAVNSFQFRGNWRWVYVVSAMIALYFNCFVATVQAFQKLPSLQPLAPTLSEAPFQIAQGALLVIMIGLGFLSVRNFHPAPAAA
jgi:hypothetical protein